MLASALSVLLALAFVGPEPGAEPALEVAAAGDYVIVEGGPASAFEAPKPRPVEFRAGGIIMERAEFTRSHAVESPSVGGGGTTTTKVASRLRAQLEARSGQLRALAQIQDARNLADPIEPTRAGFHQLFAELRTEVARGTLVFRAGRQEYLLGNLHLFANAPWSAGQRSWDGVYLGLTGARAGFGVFGGSLARPLLSASAPLVEHVGAQVELDWVVDAWIEVADALVIEGLVWGDHRRDAADRRNMVTSGLRFRGELAPGLSYEAEGQLQLGLIERLDLVQRQVAGHAFAMLDYVSPRAIGPAKAKPGAFVLFDFASGSKCTTTAFVGLEPCTEGTSHDFDSSWMARHRWFGWADRFRAQNVIDTNAGLRLRTRPSKQLGLDFELNNHVFAFAQPGGRWHDTSGALIGIDLDNRNPWAADEIDLVITLTRDWLHFDAGWMIVANLAGGRALSGEALRQFVYLRATIELWSPWS